MPFIHTVLRSCSHFDYLIVHAGLTPSLLPISDTCFMLGLTLLPFILPSRVIPNIALALLVLELITPVLNKKNQYLVITSPLYTVVVVILVVLSSKKAVAQSPAGTPGIPNNTHASLLLPMKTWTEDRKPRQMLPSWFSLQQRSPNIILLVNVCNLFSTYLCFLFKTSLFLLFSNYLEDGF